MPLYAYKCAKCDYSCKLFHGIEEECGKCPNCNEKELQKQLNVASNMIINTKDDPKKRIEKFIEETRVSVAEQIAEARKDFVK